MHLEIDPIKRAELAAAFKTHVAAYREWALDPRTTRFLTLAADYATPNRSTPEIRAIHSEAVAALVKKETIEQYIDLLFRLEEYAGFVPDQNGLPETSYGATPPAKKPKKTKPAEPPQA
jgi:hypothetical protein